MIKFKIIRLQTVSHDSMLVGWNQSTTLPNFILNSNIKKNMDSKADIFRVIYSKNNQKDVEKTIMVNATSHEILLTQLEADTEYIITIVAENAAGESTPSRSRIARTYG